MQTPETAMLSKLLDLSVQRQQIIAGNIANANTPGYIRQKVAFEEAMGRSNPSQTGALESLRGEIVEDYSKPARSDGNNVDLGEEIGELMQNGVYHQLLSRVLAAKMRIYHQSVS